eukprot:CAMPEP_0182562798 /NCGR_PEP_ID=MMETSP1324-20130603/5088_1 /TAXON_ID=236786 /ORGANISM="Florenciella sp., Strain RCC1587" /LENGTH=156 /DNA_ID=CAMNT_0024775849 /DNA_START=297 /DNA_END=768 /DNA_ORIENTATION=+
MECGREQSSEVRTYQAAATETYVALRRTLTHVHLDFRSAVAMARRPPPEKPLGINADCDHLPLSFVQGEKWLHRESNTPLENRRASVIVPQIAGQHFGHVGTGLPPQRSASPPAYQSISLDEPLAQENEIVDEENRPISPTAPQYRSCSAWLYLTR